MNKNIQSCVYGSVVLIIALFQLFSAIRQPSTQAGFFLTTDTEAMTIENITVGMPAWNSGLRVGDKITKINDIDTIELIDLRIEKNVQGLFLRLSQIFQMFDTYSITTDDGIVHHFTLTPLSLWNSLQSLALTMKVNFIIGFIFIIFGFILSFLIVRDKNLFLFCRVLFSLGITIINSHTVMSMSLEYTFMSRLLFEISVVVSGCLFLFFVIHFFEKTIYFKSACIIAKIITIACFVFLLLMYVLELTGIIGIYSSFALYKGIFLFILLFVLGISFSIYTVLQVSNKPTMLLRFILVGLLSSVGVSLINIVTLLLSSALLLSSSYQMLFIQGSYIFIPFTALIASLQFKSVTQQKIFANVLIFLIYFVISGLCVQLLLLFSNVNYLFLFVVLSAVIPFIYLVLFKVIHNFLYASTRHIRTVLDELEEKLFAFESSKDVFSWTVNWLCSTLDATFVQIVSVDDENNFNLIYTVENKASLYDIDFIRNERKIVQEKHMVIRHGKAGFSVPLFNRNALWGYFFIGAKMSGDEYRDSEAGLFLPASRIFMQALSFLNATEVVRQKKDLQSAFSRYLSPELVDAIMVTPDAEVRIGGEKRELTAFFTDLEGFSSISEQLDANELVRLINMYLNEMSAVIMSLGGTIDKFEGDAIMAFFGAPNVMKDHAINACLAALRMKKMEEILNEQILHEKLSPVPLFTRIGINTGEMVVGNMGSLNRLDYTIIGNEVNIAARLESANKIYNTGILISSKTYGFVSEYFACRRLPALQMKGISKAVAVYELVGEQNKIQSTQFAALQCFNEGMVCFEDHNYESALEYFVKSKETFDEPFADLFIKQTQERIDSAL